MNPLTTTLLAAALATANASCASAPAGQPALTEPPMPEAPQPVRDLVASPANALAPWRVVPMHHAPGETRRNVPMVQLPSPWGDAPFHLEVPEYTWAKVDGDPHSADPIFYGREIGVNPAWTIRNAQLEQPAWVTREDGTLALDCALEGGLVQHFRVVPGDRMVEVWFGLTNGGEKPLNDVWVQLCAQSWGIPGFSAKDPRASTILVEGQPATWDAAGQDLSWIENWKDESGEFTTSAFFTAQDREHFFMPEPADGMMRPDFMLMTKPVDVPAIAKDNAAMPGRHFIVYSPFGQNAFYNCVAPCFHADPHAGTIAPGETRWTWSAFMFVEGDAGEFLRRLSALHEGLRQEQGMLAGPEGEPAKAE